MLLLFCILCIIMYYVSFFLIITLTTLYLPRAGLYYHICAGKYSGSKVLPPQVCKHPNGIPWQPLYQINIQKIHFGSINQKPTNIALFIAITSKKALLINFKYEVSVFLISCNNSCKIWQILMHLLFSKQWSPVLVVVRMEWNETVGKEKRISVEHFEGG